MVSAVLRAQSYPSWWQNPIREFIANWKTAHPFWRIPPCFTLADPPHPHPVTSFRRPHRTILPQTLVLDSPSPREHQKYLTTCLPCKIASNARGQEVEAPLPTERIQSPTPFAVSGLDFSGSLYTKKDQSAMSYILPLTCATTRALHLELSSDMSVDKSLMALDRFVSRQGLPHTVFR